MSPAQAEVDGEVQDGGTTRGQWRQPGETDVDPFILLIVATFHGHVQVFSRVRLCDSVDCSPPGSSANGIFQARILEWVAISFSRGYSQPRDQTPVSCIAGRFFTTEPPRKQGYNVQDNKYNNTALCYI